MPCLCFSCVSTGSVGVVQCMGDFSKTQEPGLGIVCCPFQTVFPVSLAVQQLACSSECKTKDNVTLSVTTAVQYRINKENVKAAVFEITDPQSQMKSHVDNVLRSTLPSMDLDNAYSLKEDMVKDILADVKAAMGKYGYDILNVLITDLRPEQSVLRAMNEINASRRLREAAVEKGEASKILQVKASEADAEAKHLAGKGIAKMRSAITEGFKGSVQLMQDCGLDTKETIHMMMVTQYLDTMKEFANPKASIMIPHGPGAIKDIEAQIRNGFLSSQAPTPL